AIAGRAGQGAAPAPPVSENTGISERARLGSVLSLAAGFRAARSVAARAGRRTASATAIISGAVGRRSATWAAFPGRTVGGRGRSGGFRFLLGCHSGPCCEDGSFPHAFHLELIFIRTEPAVRKDQDLDAVIPLEIGD